MKEFCVGRSQRSTFCLILLSFFTFICQNNGDAAGIYYSPADLGANSYEELNTLFKDYLKVLEKVKIHSKPISGQVNLRTPRSELVGDMAHALRLYQLAELDRMYGAKSRPRFGKRSEITEENVPSYGGGYDDSPTSGINDIAGRSSISGDDERR